MTRQIVDDLTLTGTLNVTGAVDLDTTLNVDGVTTHVGDVIASIIRKAVETGFLQIIGGTSITQGPFITLNAKDAGGADDGKVQIVSTTESSAVGDHESFIYDGTTFNLFAAMRAANWMNQLSHPAIAHGMTGVVPTNVYAYIRPTSLTTGGLDVVGISDTDATALVLAGIIGSADPADTTPAVILYGTKKSGTGVQAIGAAETILAASNSGVTIFRMLGNGDILAAGKMILNGLTSALANSLGVKAGTSTNDAAVGGVLYTVATTVGNVGAGDDVLASYTVPAATLAVNLQSLWFEAWGTTTGTGNSKSLRVNFGATQITALSVSFPSLSMQWVLRGRVIRDSSTNVRAYVQVTAYSASDDSSHVRNGVDNTVAVTLANANDLQIIGNAVADNDIVLHGMVVGWDDANT